MAKSPPNPDGTCGTCSEVHTRCAGHKHQRRGGGPCMQYPIPGGTVCARAHGGNAKQVRAAAQARLTKATQEKAMAEALAEAFAGNPPDIDPAEAMLFAVATKYAEVVYLRGQVARLDEADLVWGVTKTKDGGDDCGETREAKPNIWWAMLRTAEEQLVKFAAAARAAGCDERRVQLAESQADLVADAIRQIIDGLHLTTEQAQLVPELVPRVLRAIGGVT